MTEQRLVGHAYTVGFDLGNGRNIQVNGTFFVDDDKASMDQKLDHIMAVLERQRARCELERYEMELKQRHRALRDNKELLAKLEANLALSKTALHDAEAAVTKYVDKRITAPSPVRITAERLNQQVVGLEKEIENAKLNILKIELDIPEGEKALAEAKQRAA